jgi:hypothetical protein
MSNKALVAMINDSPYLVPGTKYLDHYRIPVSISDAPQEAPNVKWRLVYKMVARLKYNGPHLNARYLISIHSGGRTGNSGHTQIFKAVMQELYIHDRTILAFGNLNEVLMSKARSARSFGSFDEMWKHFQDLMKKNTSCGKWLIVESSADPIEKLLPPLKKNYGIQLVAGQASLANSVVDVDGIDDFVKALERLPANKRALGVKVASASLKGLA